MSRVLLNWIALFAHVALISAVSLPSCQLSDSECLKNTAQSAVPMLTAGIPDIGAESLDPLHLEKVKVDLAGLKLLVRDADVTNLKNSIIDKITVNLDKQILKIVYHADVTLKGKYKASGQLLILPISGDGNVTLQLNNIEVNITIPFELSKNADGQDIMDLQSFKFKYNVKTGAKFILTNLFNGNKQLSDAMLKFMNENWKIITEEFGSPLLQAAHEKVFDSMKKLMSTQPLQIAS